MLGQERVDDVGSAPPRAAEPDEVVEGELVPEARVADDGASRLVRGDRRAQVLAVGAAAVAGTGFVAGAIATAVVARRVVGANRSRAALPLRGHDVAGTQRFLVDVHVLRPR